MTIQVGLPQPGRAQRLARLPGRLSGRAVWQGLAIAALVGALWSGYALSGQPVTLVIDQQPYTLRTHRPTVAALVEELGLGLVPEDRVQPLPGATLEPGARLTIALARPVVIEADGRTRELLTQQETIAGVLNEAGVLTNPRDEILVNGVFAGTAQEALALPARQAGSRPRTVAERLFAALTPRGALSAARPVPAQLIIRRAIPVTLLNGSLGSTFYTSAPNVGEALLEQGITLFLGDRVLPALGSRLSPGMRIYVERSIPVGVTVDGRRLQTRTLRQTVGEVLAQEGVVLMGQDFTRPAPTTPLAPDAMIEVVRVQEGVEIEQELISFETNWIADESMELDRQEVREPGQSGVIKSRTRVRYENGQEVWRQLEDEWLDQSPGNRVIAYGTQIVVRSLATPAGPIEYWRKIPMLLTPYSAATSGKSPDDPHYGITRTGIRVGYGIAAVDPKVIPLGTKVYVPEYGVAVAADTGGLILGKHIDLAFDDGQPMPDLYGWGDVYVLTPVPPAGEVRYVLPEWPQR